MGMSAAYLDADAVDGASRVTHFGLVDETGTELTGGAPAYARIADNPVATGAAWAPSTNLIFNVPAGKTVGGWRAYDAAAAGTDFGGEDLPEEIYNQQGTYELDAAQTSVTYAATA